MIITAPARFPSWGQIYFSLLMKEGCDIQLWEALVEFGDGVEDGVPEGDG